MLDVVSSYLMHMGSYKALYKEVASETRVLIC